MQQHGQQIMQASFADDSGSIKEPLSSVAISSRPKQRYAENQAPGWVDDPYKHQDILTKHQAIASGLKMQAKLAATFDAIFAWTDPLRLRKLAQIHFSLPSGITILK